MISLTEATVPSDRSRQKLGVGEKVELRIAPNPSASVTWELSGPGELRPGGPTAEFIADERASRPVITATVSGVALAPIPYNVVEPVEEIGFKTAEIAFKKGELAAGMCIRSEVAPRDVSFHNVEVKEVPGPATKITGYFTHVSASHFEHRPTGWIQLSAINATNDGAALLPGLQPPYTDGSFEIDIPIRWRVKDSPREGDLRHVVQTISVRGRDGRVTVTKLGQRVVRRPADTSGTVKQEETCPERTL